MARGFSYDELSEEERRGRKHKNKVVLEAERQAKEALDKVKGYAVLATIDQKELTFPLLNIKQPIEEAKKTVAKELGIPIPAIIGQKAWREERAANINAAITTLVNAINAARNKQNEGLHSSVNKTYAYYMQNLNKQIEENKALRVENDVLKAENAKVKQRISQLDEKAMERVATQLGYAREELASAKSYNTTLMEMYNDLKARWNAIWLDPEMTDAWRRVEARKEREAKEKALQEAEAKRESQARQSRYLGVLDKFIHEGHEALSSFEVQFTDNAIDNFLAFVDHMSCSADTYVSLGGSNGCADQLTNWDGTQKIGIGASSKKRTWGTF